MNAILSYIRNWFPESYRNNNTVDLSIRKRKHSIDIFPIKVPKLRRLNPLFEDSFSTPPTSFRRSHNSTMQTILLDDEENDDSTFLKSRKFQNDDISFVKASASSSHKKQELKKAGVSYITRFNSKCEPIVVKTPNNSIENGTKPKQTTNKSSKKPFSSLDYSTGLDSRKEYESLLDSALLQGNNSSIYGTPLQFSFNRSRLVELDRSSARKPLVTIDLTDDSGRKKLSTKDRVIKILDEFEPTSAVSIEDSDSDVEILPTPPSPKPDIKVDPVNSLKTVVDTSNATKQTWLDEVTKKHERYLESKSREIQAYADNSTTLGEINRDLLLQSLTRKVQDSLAIKETILPVIEIEDEIELPELTNDQLRLVKQAFSGGDQYEILTKKFNLHINRADILTLSGLNWLNDNVINFYMNLIIERSQESNKWPKAYAMNTFFYQKLLSSGPESLRRWTRKVDIFAHQYICVPIHLGVHWCMAIIDLKNKTIKYYDSMGRPNNICLEALKNYLEYEHQDKKGQPFNTNDFSLINMKDIPLQMNGSDCGMFSCTFAEFATRNAKFTFSQSDMPYLRKKMVVEIVTGGVPNSPHMGLFETCYTLQAVLIYTAIGGYLEQQNMF